MPLPFKWWYGLALNLALAVLGVGGAALFVLCRGEGRSGTDSGAPPSVEESSRGTCSRRSRRLEIRDAGSGRRYGRWKLEEGDLFALEFIHSVNQSPVRETFRAEGTEIRLESVRFFSFGAGMQSDLEEGLVLGRDGEALVISGFNRSFRRLEYRVGTVSDHLLMIKGETVSLRELCGKNARISLSLR